MFSIVKVVKIKQGKGFFFFLRKNLDIFRKKCYNTDVKFFRILCKQKMSDLFRRVAESEEGMFQQGQQIIYGGNGVCRIEEIIMRESALSEAPVPMYVIRLDSGLTSFVPVSSTVFMRELISAEEAEAVISEYPSIPTRFFGSSNSKAMADQYRSILAGHNPREMLCLYKSLQEKMENARACGKKPGSMDERFSQAVLDEISKEFSAVLGCTPAEILVRLGIR